jgi:hypothetical protein
MEQNYHKFTCRARGLAGLAANILDLGDGIVLLNDHEYRLASGHKNKDVPLLEEGGIQSFLWSAYK